jgi:hypothetical protein
MFIRKTVFGVSTVKCAEGSEMHNYFCQILPDIVDWIVKVCCFPFDSTKKGEAHRYSIQISKEEVKEIYSVEMRLSQKQGGEVWDELETMWHSILTKIHTYTSTLKTTMEGKSCLYLFNSRWEFPSVGSRHSWSLKPVEYSRRGERHQTGSSQVWQNQCDVYAITIRNLVINYS